MPRIGYVPLEPLCYPTSLFDLNRPPQLLLVMAIPHTLELDTAPGWQSPTFVRHALDSPWVESRVDVLVVAVSIVVKHFLPIVCRVPPLATWKWPMPST